VVSSRLPVAADLGSRYRAGGASMSVTYILVSGHPGAGPSTLACPEVKGAERAQRASLDGGVA
jgi:hypothetical protein